MGKFNKKSGEFIRHLVPAGKKFVKDTISELKKSSWPPRNELIESTLLVMVSVVILGLFVAGADFIIREILDAVVTK